MQSRAARVRARIAAAAVILPLSALVLAQPPVPPVEGGAAEAWHRLKKLTTTASLMHVTAHPDDEQGAMLAAASRGEGVHTSLVSLNRGEAGDNAIGPELFDALGLIRTEELLLAGRYYGVDEIFFTRLADYGFSKRLDEALERWDRTIAVGDMVRTIRLVRPLVVVSRWQGHVRDGHGQHQAAGALTPEAVAAAADAAAYPELATEGLRPWRVARLFTGGVGESETWHARVDTGAHDPVSGSSPHRLGRMGLAVQRSQTGGRYDPYSAPLPLYYALASADDRALQGGGLFAGLDTTLPGLYALLGVSAPEGHVARLAAIAKTVEDAIAAFTFTNPSTAVPALARGLDAMRALAGDTSDENARHILQSKVRQFERAMVACALLEAVAIAEPPDAPDIAASGPFTPPPLLAALTPGASARVRVRVANRGRTAVEIVGIQVRDTHAEQSVVPVSFEGGPASGPVEAGATHATSFNLTVARDHRTTVTPFTRASIASSHYVLLDPRFAGRPRAPAAYELHLTLRIAGVELPIVTAVRRREAALPYGYELRDLEILPPVDVEVTPALRILRGVDARGPVRVQVTVSNRSGAALNGMVQLQVPAGWAVTPTTQALSLPAGAPETRFPFTVIPAAPGTAAHDLHAIVRLGGREYRSSVRPIRHRDLGLQYLEQPATARMRAVDVRLPPTLRVGYVMGAGDDVPAAIRQLGATVDLLDAAALASGDLGRYDTIVTGTRAYGVRPDLRTHNRRLLEYVQRGGNLVVLYNTPEFVPGAHAPLPATLPANAEEVCEEDAAVEILAPGHPVLTTPNRIGPEDFEGWIEQRGSKFFATWDAGYTPIVSSHDRGQAPQQGGFLSARVGSGHYTYMAYALHRQLPYGVPGAYRLLANLLALGYKPPERIGLSVRPDPLTSVGAPAPRLAPGTRSSAG